MVRKNERGTEEVGPKNTMLCRSSSGPVGLPGAVVQGRGNSLPFPRP